MTPATAKHNATGKDEGSRIVLERIAPP
jgi:hypothetical protein